MIASLVLAMQIVYTACSGGQTVNVNGTQVNVPEPTFKGVSLVLDGGLGGREPTTIVDLSQGFIDIVREGAGSIAALQ